MLGQLSFALALAAVTGTNAVPTSLDALFGPHVSPGTEIASSTEADFASIVGLRWSAWEVPNWSGAIKPASTCDIQQIVKIATKHNIPFLATNGGHGPKVGLSKFTGLNINLAGLNTVKVDAKKRRVTVGPGATLGELVSALFAAGLEIPTGNSWCPGAIGVTLGGGIGMLTGTYGMMIDSLRSVRLVTAKGKLVTASKTENPDLFWAIRGAGPNFGIIVEATYEVYPLSNNGNTIEANYFFGPAANRTLWEHLASYDDDLPSKLSIQAGILYDRTVNASQVWLQVWYFGPEDEAKPHLDAFAALNPVTSDVQTLTQLEVYNQSVTRGVCNRGHTISAYTLGLGRTDVPTFEEHFADITAFYEANPDYNGQSYFQLYSNKASAKYPQSETVFPWRDVQTWWLLENLYTDTSLEDRIYKWSEEQRAKLHATSGFETPHVYINYALGDEGPEAWWSPENLPKLRKLKAKWDPNHVFGLGAEIN